MSVLWASFSCSFQADRRWRLCIQHIVIQKKLAKGQKIVGLESRGCLYRSTQAETWGRVLCHYWRSYAIIRRTSQHQAFRPTWGGAEIAFVIAEDIKGPSVTTAEILQATAGVMAAIELPDLRLDPKNFTTADGIADQMGANFVVLVTDWYRGWDRPQT